MKRRRNDGRPTYDRGLLGRDEALALIGRRVQWDSVFAELGEGHIAGTVVDIRITRNGYPMLVVRWDEGAPSWWGDVISPRSDLLLVLEETP